MCIPTNYRPTFPLAKSYLAAAEKLNDPVILARNMSGVKKILTTGPYMLYIDNLYAGEKTREKVIL